MIAGSWDYLGGGGGGVPQVGGAAAFGLALFEIKMSVGMNWLYLLQRFSCGLCGEQGKC